jgi:hypothetical protein
MLVNYNVRCDVTVAPFALDKHKWAQIYPQYVVSTWIGHGIEVSARHYLQVPEELYEKVAATNKAPTATKSKEIRSLRELKSSKLLTNKKLQKSG